MILEKLSRRIAIAIKRADPEGPGSVAVLEYSIGMKLNLYTGIILTIMLGLIFNVFFQSLIALVGLIVLRRYSGGLHLPITMCSFVTAGLSTLAATISVNHFFTHLLTILSLTIVVIFAPINFDKDCYTEFHPLSKLISIILVSSNFIIQNSTLCLMFLFQSILILPIYSMRGGETK